MKRASKEPAQTSSLSPGLASLRPSSAQNARKKAAPKKRSQARSHTRLARPLTPGSLPRELIEQAWVEMQGELEESREHYATLYDFAPVGYMTLNHSGCVLDLNAAGAELLKRERVPLIGQPFAPLVSPHDHRAFLHHLRQLRRGLPRVATNLTIRRKGSEPVTLQLISVTSHTDRPKEYRTVFLDITEQFRAQQALANAHAELERNVAERTAQLAQANEKLRFEIHESQLKTQSLQASRQALAESSERIRAIVQNALDAIVTISEEGIVESFNPAAEKMFGYSERQIIGQNVSLLMPPADSKQHDRHLANYLRTGTPHIIGAGREVVARRKNGKTFPAALSISSINLASGRRFAGLLRDITEQKRAEQALRESENRFKTFMTNSPAAAFIKDNQGRYVYFNHVAAGVMGKTLTEMRGKRDDYWMPADLASEMRAHDHKVLSTLQTVRVIETIPFGPRTGSQWLAYKFPLRSARNQLFLGGVAVDVSETKRLEKELLAISDREQQRIGQDLHDGLGQELTAIELLCGSLQSKLAESAPHLVPDAARICKMARRSIAQTRRLAHGLAPVAFSGDGLDSALKELSLTTKTLPGVHCCYQGQGEGNGTKLPPPVAKHLYRIAQEAVSNAVRHSRATRINIQLSSANGCLELTISDNGRGLPPRPARSEGLGLQLMPHRASLIGAQLDIHSTPKRGVTVTCRLKLETHESAKIVPKPKKARKAKP